MCDGIRRRLGDEIRCFLFCADTLILIQKEWRASRANLKYKPSFIEILKEISAAGTGIVSVIPYATQTILGNRAHRFDEVLPGNATPSQRTEYLLCKLLLDSICGFPDTPTNEISILLQDRDHFVRSGGHVCDEVDAVFKCAEALAKRHKLSTNDGHLPSPSFCVVTESVTGRALYKSAGASYKEKFQLMTYDTLMLSYFKK